MQTLVSWPRTLATSSMAIGPMGLVRPLVPRTESVSGRRLAFCQGQISVNNSTYTVRLQGVALAVAGVACPFAWDMAKHEEPQVDKRNPELGREGCC